MIRRVDRLGRIHVKQPVKEEDKLEQIMELLETLLPV
jgi:hypothetical protein